jgi:hypothetical protein
MKELIVMPMTPKNNMYAIRITDLFTEQEMAVALTRFKTRQGVIEFLVDFTDYTYIFTHDLTAKEVDLGKVPHVFDAIVNAARRLRSIIGFSDTRQVDSYRLTRTTVFIVVRYEVPTNEHTGDL